MKTFAEYLPTMTAREREIVEAFHLAMEVWHDNDNPEHDWPFASLQSTPPAKEPASVDGVIVEYSDGTKSARIFDQTTIKPGDRVRVVKIEEPT